MIALSFKLRHALDKYLVVLHLIQLIFVTCKQSNDNVGFSLKKYFDLYRIYIGLNMNKLSIMLLNFGVLNISTSIDI